MTTATFSQLADSINAALESLNGHFAAGIEHDPHAVYFAFAFDPEALEAVLRGFAERPALWAEFLAQLPTAAAADELRATLTRLAVEAGELDQSIEWGEVSLDVDVPVGMRKRIGHDLQMNKRALLSLRQCPPFGELAERINQAADGPVFDGLTLAALAYVVGADLGLLAMVATVVHDLRPSAS
jgi:hypothetical protein